MRPLLITAEQVRRWTAHGEEEAWRLQMEYAGWRKELGFDPPRDVLNRWEQAMERIGEAARLPRRRAVP